jgi:prepilin-type processing-associated H-X9-DG protein
MRLPRVRFSIRGFLLLNLFVCIMLAFMLWLPHESTSPRAALRTRCANNLRQIALALEGYHGRHGRFPPPYVTDADGKPMHSWRTLILPFLGRQDVYDAYKFDEPWDGPNNRKVTDVDLACYRCPSRLGGGRGLTDYVVILGPGTAFPEGDTRPTTRDIRDDPAFTILVAEAGDMGIRWAEPRDLDVSRMDLRINDTARPGLSSRHPGAINVVMMDGSYKILFDGMSPETLRALITIDGHESVVLDE